MLKPSVRQFQAIGWVVLLVTLFCLGLSTGVTAYRRATRNVLPDLIRIARSEGGGPASGNIVVEDQQTIAMLDSLFPNYRQEAQAGPATSPPGEHFVLEFIRERQGKSTRLFVWSEGGQEYWQAGSSRLPVHGSLRRLLEWLPVHQAISMATQLDVARAIAPWRVAEGREESLGIVIDNARHQVGGSKLWITRDLQALVELSAPRTKHQNAGFPTFYRIEGLVSGPLPASASQLPEIRKVVFDSLLVDTDKYASITTHEAGSILALVADEATIEELAQRLKTQQEFPSNSDLLVCLQGCLGLPAFQRGGMCGNSSPAEFEQYRKQEQQRLNEAKGACLEWYEHWKANPADRQSAVLAAWKSELTRKPHEFEIGFEAHTKRFRNLLRCGSVMLPAVEVAQTEASNLDERGALEFLKAYWTGDCNRTLVEELLKGDHHSQMVACNIIAAAADASWKEELAALLRMPQPRSGNLGEWFKMMETAADTLVICHGVDAVHLLSEVEHFGFHRVHFALKHFQGSP